MIASSTCLDSCHGGRHDAFPTRILELRSRVGENVLYPMISALQQRRMTFLSHPSKDNFEYRSVDMAIYILDTYMTKMARNEQEQIYTVDHL